MKSILKDSKTGEAIKPPHGNKKFTNFISGQRMTYAEWGRKAKESAENLVRVFKEMRDEEDRNKK